MDEEDFRNLSIEDACNHKVWKARLIGYEAALHQFQQIEDEKSNEWMKYVGLVKKFVVDCHALCQEKGLEAVLTFVENCGVAGKTTADVVSGIIQKCLAAPKARTKELGSQVIFKYIEIEKYELVVEELLKGTESKNPKVIAACVRVLAQALKEFGPKVINVTKLLKRIPPILEDRDKVVRQEAKMLAYEMYRWLGPSLKPQLTGILKPNQLAEIENDYENFKETPVKPTRFLRSQQEKKASTVLEGGDKSNSGDGDSESGGDLVEEADPFELLEPVDILSQLNKEFYTKLESKKWVDRKDVLEELDKLLEVSPKLENTDYEELLRTLKTVIQKDSNVVVVMFAVKCVTGIAKGLRKNFHQYASSIITALLEKFKEKKPNVNSALKDAVDAVYRTTNLDALYENISSYLDNKNPNVKSETCEFVSRCLSKSSPSAVNKKVLKSLCKGLTNCICDQDPTVRHNAALALGTIMKLVGERVISPFIVDIEPSVMKKIKEHCETVKLASPTAAKNTKLEKNADNAEKSEAIPKVVKKSKLVKPLPTSSLPISEVKHLGREEALNVAKNIIPKEMYEGMLSDDKEKRDVACERLSNILDTIPIQDETGQALLALIALHDLTLPGTSLVLRMELLKRIVEKYPTTPEGMAPLLFEISNQLTNPSCEKYVTEILTVLAKSTSVVHIADIIFGSEDITEAVIEPHAKLWAEKIKWMAHAIMTTGVINNPTPVFEFGRKASLHSNPNVRNAGLALIGIVYLKGMQRDTCYAASQKSSVTPLKTVNPSQKTAEKENSRYKSPEKAVEQPKLDIGTKITENILADLADKNWKVRAEAVSELHSIISSAQSITGNLGDAAPLIAARIQDSNAKISSTAISLVESLAPKMGPSCKRYIPVFLPALLKAIGDPKVWVRSAVIPCLNTWGGVTGYANFFEGEIIADALKTVTSAVRAELWSWLSAKLPDIPPKAFPKEELVACLPVLYSNFEDRSAEVRKYACKCTLGFMLHLGYNNMVQAVDNIKGSGNSARIIKEHLEKTRGSLPIVSLQKPKTALCSTGESSICSTNEEATMAPSRGSVKSKKASTPSSRSIRFRGKKEEDDSPLLQINNLKHQRVIDEQKLKILKWHFVGTPRPEFIELLKELMYSANINKALIANMFHVDFRYHLRAIENLTEDLHVNKEAMKCNLDLILRWMTLRFFDTNPSVLLKGLEYLNAVFSVLIEEEYTMLDSEANGFIPYLILKFGDPKDAVRNSVRLILKQISSVYPSSKLFSFLTEGIKSKSARQRSECLDQMAWLIDTHGISVCHPSLPAAMREIAKLIGDRDNAVRNSALNCVVATYFIEGDKVLKMIDEMSEKDSFLLKDRIRRASRNKPLNFAKPLMNEEAAVKPMSANSAGGAKDSSESNITMVTCSSQILLEEPDHGETFNQAVDTQTITTATVVAQATPNKTVVAQAIPNTDTFLGPTPSSGPYRLDLEVVENIECVGSHFIRPKLVEIDLRFLEDSSHKSFEPIRMAKMTPTLSNNLAPSEIEMEIANIVSSDIDKSMSAIAKIETITLSDKCDLLIEFADRLVSQLVNLISILNLSSHPEVVNCYKATFSLFMKFCNSKDLCSQLTEPTLYKILEQFLLLLREPTMDNKANMFVRVINTLILRFLEKSNKTNITCALFQILNNCVSNPKTTDHYKELVVKCLWKLNKTLPEWDSELDYTKVLTEFNIFLKNHPTSWWKKEGKNNDFPLRTLKTLLHTMIKIRGVEVLRTAEEMPNIAEDSELFLYITRIVKNVKFDGIRQEIRLKKERQCASEGKTSTENSFSRGCATPEETQQRLTKGEQDELPEIFRMVEESEDTQEGIQKLYLVERTNPHVNVEPFLDRTKSHFQWYVRNGIKTKEEEGKEFPAGTRPNDNTTSIERWGLKDKDRFSQEAKVLWSKLKAIQKKACCQVEKNKEELLEQFNERPRTALDSTPGTDPFNLESLKKRLEKFKYEVCI